MRVFLCAICEYFFMINVDGNVIYREDISLEQIHCAEGFPIIYQVVIDSSNSCDTHLSKMYIILIDTNTR